ncbi:protein SprT [Caldalkalibacillus thermarum]|uniref:SprT-like domain-containing protein n=1 Tax=Caldalkalibacillus thermarum TaxID=296745 RepID=UPI00166E98A8|nr:SprT-like domain-containing protein [Caldalkalibacillus thermarum]GGK25153.1 protein SprT [Caldalkalibacillus thermarum]
MARHPNPERTIDTDPQKLKRLANKLSLHFWGKPCQIPVTWNGRLTKTMGRFLYTEQNGQRTPLKIEISKYAAHWIDREIFVAVLLHELCHYHLFIEGRPYHDHHPVFEQELRRVGAISTQRVQLPQKAYKLYCQRCGGYLGLRRRINVGHYRSICCRAPILKAETWLGEFRYDGHILKNSKVRLPE